MENLVNLNFEEITGTTDATPGTRSSHTISGFTVAPTRGQVEFFVASSDDDVNNAAAVNFVTATTTSLTVKSNVASKAFTARIWRKKIDGESLPTSNTSLSQP